METGFVDLTTRQRNSSRCRGRILRQDGVKKGIAVRKKAATIMLASLSNCVNLEKYPVDAGQISGDAQRFLTGWTAIESAGRHRDRPVESVKTTRLHPGQTPR